VYICDTSDSGALTTSHSSTTVQQIQEVGSLEPKICVEDKSCVEKNTRKRTHASSSRAAAEEDVLTKTDKMLTHDSKMLTHASKMSTHASRVSTADCSRRSVDRTHLGRAVNRKTNTTALIAEVDDELNWGNTLYEAIHSWLQDADTPSTRVFLANIDPKTDRAVEPANQRQAYKYNHDKWRASELKEIQALTESQS